MRLKRAILDRFRPEGVTEQQVFLGHGSFNLLERLIHKFLKPGMMAGVGPQFSEVPSEFAAAGGHYRSFRLLEPDGALPMAALEKALDTDGWSVLYVDNPNNPLGRSFELGDLDRLAAICDRNGTALLVDEAFGDYLDDSASAVHLLPQYRNLIVVRSFSKALGLAGERIGYMFMSPELARAYREVDVPFEPGVVAQTLAIETLADSSWIERVRLEVRHAKSRIVGALAHTDMSVLPTHPDVAIMAVHRPGADLSCDFRRTRHHHPAGIEFRADACGLGRQLLSASRLARANSLTSSADDSRPSDPAAPSGGRLAISSDQHGAASSRRHDRADGSPPLPHVFVALWNDLAQRGWSAGDFRSRGIGRARGSASRPTRRSRPTPGR